MTVKELITELSKFDEDLEVTINWGKITDIHYEEFSNWVVIRDY